MTRRPRGLWLLVAVAGTALLLSFGRAVQTVTAQAQVRHTQTRERAHALWRCSGLAASAARKACRAAVPSGS